MGNHAEPAVGDRIADKYVVERVLGRGGMGLVLAARHVDLGQLVAIKVILPAALRDPAAAERLLREARASARLRSEHVARVFDVGRMGDGAPYLVMELLEGSDLIDKVQSEGALPAALAALYVAQACEAIGEAHAAGFVHRDLKPANLFLTTRRDGSPCVKVLDFGIAKEEGFEGARMTSTGSVLGTPLYMPPEQLKSSRAASPASDVWALGITLYELATGAIPYDASSIPELFAKILTERPVPPRERLPSLSPAFESVVLRCLEADPARRFRSAAELREALLPLASTVASDWTAAPTVAAPLAVAFSVAATAHLRRPDVPPPDAAPHAATQLGGATAPGTVQSVTAAGRTASGAPGGRVIVLGALVALLGVAAGGGLWWARGRGAIEVPRPGAAVGASPVADVSPAPTSAPTVAPMDAAEPSIRASDPAPGELTAPSASGSSPLASPAAPSASSAPPPSASAAPATDRTPPRPRAPAKSPPPAPSPAQTGWGGML